MTNTKDSKKLFDELIEEINDSRKDKGPQTLEEVLEDMDIDIHKNAILSQVLLFLCHNLWYKVYGTKLTKDQLFRIKEAIQKQNDSAQSS